jgi:hypothetical protein
MNSQGQNTVVLFSSKLEEGKTKEGDIRLYKYQALTDHTSIGEVLIR